jgi:hypothetical protein
MQKSMEEEMTCEYEIWDKKKKILRQCGKELIDIVPLVPPNLEIVKKRLGERILTPTYLCEEHKAFVIDCLKTDYYIAHKNAINNKKQKELFEN